MGVLVVEDPVGGIQVPGGVELHPAVLLQRVQEHFPLDGGDLLPEGGLWVLQDQGDLVNKGSINGSSSFRYIEFKIQKILVLNICLINTHQFNFIIVALHVETLFPTTSKIKRKKLRLF